MMRVLPSLIVVLALCLVSISCGGGNTDGTTTSHTTNPTTSPTAQTSGSFTQMAELGIHVYAVNCAGCHGANGQGASAMALVGNPTTPVKYPTAAALLSKISTTMPPGKAGSLTQAAYYQVLSFLLVQNKWVNAGDLFNPSNLSQITLK